MARPSFLFDSNVHFAATGVSPEVTHPDAEAATELIELLNKFDCDYFVSAATRDDIARARNPARRKASRTLVRQWKHLNKVSPSPELLEKAGFSLPLGPNDEVDASLLALLDASAVDFLVTQDKRLRGHAYRAGLGDRAFGIRGAIDQVRRLFGTLVEFPTLERVEAYELDTTDPMFDSLRADYPGFDRWFDEKCRPERRTCLVVRSHERAHMDSLAILKPEGHGPYGLEGEILKVCTFKVSERATGAKRGELLLKDVLSYARARRHNGTYVEVLPRHENLIEFLAQFGFQDHGARTSRGELVLVKRLHPPQPPATRDPVEFHRLYGPEAILVRDAFVVPIQPRWHDTLFPEARIQLQLGDPTPSGYALRKAYLSKSKIASLHRGATILFYRSRDVRAVTAVGVVDDVFRSDDPDEIRRRVGQRTVYTDAEIREFCADGTGVLGVLFRHDRVLTRPWRLADLQRQAVLNDVPQAIQRVKDEGGLAWVREQLAAR